jgi:exopolysaccharide biosynthesis WecB/TagA/CpsF family protein
MAERVRASGARLCLVALGAPKQELLADALAPHCPSVGFLCVGAALNFVGGHSRRAPLWMRRIGLEWLWRLGAEPYRLAARYAACAYVFLLLGFGVDVVPAEERR